MLFRGIALGAFLFLSTTSDVVWASDDDSSSLTSTTPPSQLRIELQKYEWDPSGLDGNVKRYQQLQQWYFSLSRPLVGPDEMVLIKYQWQVLNRYFADQLVQALYDLRKEMDSQARQELLDSLPIVLSHSENKRLKIKPHAYGADGKLSGVKLLDPTKYSDYNEWKNKKDFSDFPTHPDQEAVVYKGITFRTGDVVLSDLNYTTYEMLGQIRTPVQIANHTGIFVMMHNDHGEKVPTIFDMHRNGLRATPLSLYLSEKVNSYIEVHRLKGSQYQQGGWETKMRDAFQKAVDEEEGFPFDFAANTQDRDTGYICTEIVDEFYLRAGLPQTKVVTRGKPQAISNLNEMGPFSANHLSPSDYSLNGDFKLVGVLDMLHVKKNLISRLGGLVMGKFLAQSKINVEALRKKLKDKAKIVSQMQKKDHLSGKFFRDIAKINHRNFPVGDPLFVAAAKFFEDELRKAADRCLASSGGSDYRYFKKVFGSITPQDLDVEAFFNDPDHYAVLEKKLSHLGKYFDEVPRE